MASHPPRPIILTILAILAIIGGIFSLIVGIAALASGGLAVLGGGLAGKAEVTHAGGLLLGVGIGGLIVGILDLAFGIGTLEARHWAWVLGVASQAISLASALINVIVGGVNGDIGGAILGNIINILIAGALLYYLYTPRVRAYFDQNVRV